jgi:two-component system, NarL family, nitrate/nitrite response regulator NarL
MTAESETGNTRLSQGAQQLRPRRTAHALSSAAPIPRPEVATNGSRHSAGFQAEDLRRVSAESQNGDGPMETRDLRLLISDRTALGCELMLLTLSKRRDLVGSAVWATSSAEVERVARTQQPDIALISAGLSDGPLAGFRVLPTLQNVLPECRVIVLLDDNNEELAIDAFRAHARGVFHRSDHMEQLVKCIDKVRQGEVWVRPGELRAVFDAFAECSTFRSAASTNFQLNDREMMVARLVAEGQTNRQIGRRLNLSEHTVKNYLYRVFEKVGVRSRVELAVLMVNGSEKKRGKEPGGTSRSE